VYDAALPTGGGAPPLEQARLPAAELVEDPAALDRCRLGRRAGVAETFLGDPVVAATAHSPGYGQNVPPCAELPANRGSRESHPVRVAGLALLSGCEIRAQVLEELVPVPPVGQTRRLDTVPSCSGAELTTEPRRLTEAPDLTRS
jgi:hypothetical protein